MLLRVARSKVKCFREECSQYMSGFDTAHTVYIPGVLQGFCTADTASTSSISADSVAHTACTRSSTKYAHYSQYTSSMKAFVRFSSISYYKGAWLLTPACGFAHARNGQGCRQIEAVNATVLPKGALRKFHC